MGGAGVWLLLWWWWCYPILLGKIYLHCDGVGLPARAVATDAAFDSVRTYAWRFSARAVSTGGGSVLKKYGGKNCFYVGGEDPQVP